ncbi:glycoside hydrolase family 43 protein [Arcicella sp. LKC2W]|uniref:glycoside hydrolase family 43 protein n=1 Tax=Arcicella sp. LKC2W TaxID=2984198 RepID=UPI002B1F204B|nr:glycoside hydrolase family 43 protein [Arcicella sp. LKC2W]MEA5460416.1 glycoside hydrolase family 43 protein [Arcicella sp. LKC2W]
MKNNLIYSLTYNLLAQLPESFKLSGSSNPTKLCHVLYLLFLSLFATACSKDVYLFTSFHEPATDGLRMLHSTDGYHWKDLNKILLKPTSGSQKVMRDPSIVQGNDGTFHLVWTSSWRGDLGFGYANSKDLIHWSEQQFIKVMEHEPTTINVWAPELFFDKSTKQFTIIWASCIPNRFEKGIEDENNNHRMYFTQTADFKTFTVTKLLLDPKFSVIDAVIVERKKEDFILILKDNTRPNRNIKVAFGKTPTGDFTNVSAPFTKNFTEGPSVVKVGNEWLIYYDSYQDKTYGAMKTTDFEKFTDISKQISIPEGHKHGTIFKVKKRILNALLQK